MKIGKLFTYSSLFLLSSTNANANAKEHSVESLITNCLNLKSSLNSALANGPVNTTNGKILGVEKASFHYQNLDRGFKGICSNAQFSIERHGLRSTEENQRYVFVWSKELDVEASELSVENIEYSLEQPKNINNWLTKKL